MAHPDPSLVHGPVAEPLWTTTLGALIESQARHYGSRTAVVFPQQQVRRTYHELFLRSKLVAKALLHAGLRYGDAVGIMAGNCYEYVEVFLGAARIGCPVVVLNTNYTPKELLTAVTVSRMEAAYQSVLCSSLADPGFADCKLLCVAQRLGQRTDLTEHLHKISSNPGLLRRLVLFTGSHRATSGPDALDYAEFIAQANDSGISELALSKEETRVRASDVVNLQFTSGGSQSINQDCAT